MILTIQASSPQTFRTAIWEASEMMGLDVEAYADNTFKVIVHDKIKADRILQKASGRVIDQTNQETILRFY